MRTKAKMRIGYVATMLATMPQKRSGRPVITSGPGVMPSIVPSSISCPATGWAWRTTCKPPCKSSPSTRWRCAGTPTPDHFQVRSGP